MPLSDLFGHERAVRALRAAMARGRVHHAYLFAGPEGVGKETCARLFAQALNCEVAGGEGCGSCNACKRIAHGVHPDVLWVMPEAEAVRRRLLTRADLDAAPSRDIRVEQVRDLRAALALRALEGRFRVAVILHAERMNATSQNVLLKTLEEPPPATTLILITSAPDALLSTIRSRCARILFGPLPEEVVAREVAARNGLSDEEAALWARAAQGSLGAALALDAEKLVAWRDRLRRLAEVAGPAEVVALAEELSERADAEEALAALSLFWRDVAAAAGGAPDELLVLRDLADLARARAAELGARAALERADGCARALEGLSRNGNPRLMLERCLLEAMG